MNFVKWLFGFDDPPPSPPQPVVEADLASVRDNAGNALAALRRRQEEERRRREKEARRREEERQRHEEDRRRREEEEARREKESGEPFVANAPPAPRFQVSSGARYCIASVRSSLETSVPALDLRAFSRRVMQGVKDVYGGNPVPFYTAAELSRSAYSKLISHPDRHPAKDTVLAMAAAFKMTPPEAEGFLRLAGYALSESIPADLVWRACFAGGVHHLPQIRKLLAEFAAD
jgi:hypothetical protein